MIGHDTTTSEEIIMGADATDAGTATDTKTDAAGSTTAPAADKATTDKSTTAPVVDAGKTAADAAAKTANEAVLTELAEAKAKLRELEEKDLSEGQKAVKKLADAEKELAELRARDLRRTVADEKGVPAELRDFLSGATKADLEASAEKVLAAFKAKATTSEDEKPTGGRRGQSGLGGVRTSSTNSTTKTGASDGFDPKAAGRVRL